MRFPQTKHLLIIVLIFTCLTRLYRLDYPNKFYFDEVYHAFTAKEYLYGSKAAWDPWSKPPEGVAYEWTHPPLAKEIMATSMFLLGSTESWAYRLPGVIFGVLSVYLVYLLGKTLFKNQNICILAAFIFSLDGLNFVQSRIGMNDIYFVTFTLTSIYFFLRKRFVISAIALGLSLASKWTAIYLTGMLLILTIGYIFTVLRSRIQTKIAMFQNITRNAVYFLVIPPLVYLASYIPYFWLNYSVDQFIELQKQMWWYHTGLKATHAYASPWWSWPLNLYPVWYFVDYQKNNIANIFASGNPLLFLFGTISILLTIWQAFKKKSENLLIILLGFFAFWLPWAVSPRIMFLYHFSPSVPFLSLSLGYNLGLWLEKRGYQRVVLIILSLIFIGFILLYPFLTAIPLSKDFIRLFFLTNLTKNPFN